jgi:hypothetical protein
MGTNNGFVYGQFVQIKSGSFKGRIAYLDDFDNEGRTTQGVVFFGDMCDLVYGFNLSKLRPVTKQMYTARRNELRECLTKHLNSDPEEIALDGLEYAMLLNNRGYLVDDEGNLVGD